MSEGITIERYVGMEMIIVGEANPEMEIAGGINVKWDGPAWDYVWSMEDAFVDYRAGWPAHYEEFENKKQTRVWFRNFTLTSGS